MITIKFKKLHPEAVLPEYKTLSAAGGDLRSVEDLVIPSKEWQLVRLGFAVSFPQGYEIQVRPRSGLALNHGITILNSPGTVDCDYRGEMKVNLINHGPNAFFISKGDRIAQMVVNSIRDKMNVTFEEVEELDKTARGEGGFGSTGRN